MVVIIKNKEVVPLPQLWRTALKTIFTPKTLGLTEKRDMELAIVNWVNHLDLKRDMNGGVLQEGTVDSEHQLMLEIIGSELKKDMDGELDARKELFRRRGVDYRKFYRLPGSITQEDLYKGQVALKEHMKSNPEDYL